MFELNKCVKWLDEIKDMDAHVFGFSSYRELTLTGLSLYYHRIGQHL